MINKKLESKIQKEILDYLESICYTRKIIVANREGTPDIICCIQGKFVAFEVKRPGKKLDPLQVYNKQEIEKNKGLAFRVDCLEQAIKIVSQL